MNLKTLDKYLVNAIIILAIGFIIFASTLFFGLSNIEYLIGWCYGAFISYTMFYLNIALSKFFLRKRRSYWNARIFGSIKFFVNTFYAAILIFISFIINPMINGHGLFNHTAVISDFYGPINIFTMIAGMSIVAISIVWSTILSISKKRSINTMPKSIVNGE